MLELVQALVETDLHAKLCNPRSIRYEIIVRKRYGRMDRRTLTHVELLGRS